MTEIVILFCTIFGTVIAYQAYRKSQGKEKQELRDARNNMMVQFSVAQKIATHFLGQLLFHCEENQAYTNLFVGNITFAGFILELTRIVQTELSDEAEDKLKGLELSLNNIQSFTLNFTNQINNLTAYQNYFNMTYGFSK